jgi:hypothetical protein
VVSGIACKKRVLLVGPNPHGTHPRWLDFETVMVESADDLLFPAVAQEASDIVIMDDNFASIVSAVMWGRCVRHPCRRGLRRLVLLAGLCVCWVVVSRLNSSELEEKRQNVSNSSPEDSS